MSPAILTETAWALAHEKPRTIPSKVVVFATTRSRDQIRKELFESGVWETLRNKLRVKPDQLIFTDTGDHIRVITRKGVELEDLRTPEDNRAAADFILDHLRSFTENPDVHIVASIAGGRKTMGALLYAAMSLIGRETDRITHILVEESLEQLRNPKFYFPRNKDDEAKIYLADIPFVPLRNRFAECGRLPGTFTRLVQMYSRQFARDSIQKVPVRLIDETCTICVGDTSISLRQRAYAVMKYAIKLNLENRVPTGIAIDEDDFLRFLTQEKIAKDWTERLNIKEDIRRELAYLRAAFARAGIMWMPGRRRDALRLPPFTMMTSQDVP